MDATQVLIHYQDVEGRLDRRGRWSWALEGQSVTRGVAILVGRALVEIAHSGEPTRASIQLRRDPLHHLNWIDPEVVGLCDERFGRSSAESFADPAGPTPSCDAGPLTTQQIVRRIQAPGQNST